MIVLEVVLIVLVGIVSVLLSCVALSGGWLMLLLALVLSIMNHWEFPSWQALVVIAVLCIVVELIEAGAAAIGVKAKGGSKQAAMLSVVAGVIGGLLGAAWIPPVGALIGMFVGIFITIYLVEVGRLKAADNSHKVALSIALSGSFAKLCVIGIKVLSTLAIIGYLLFGLLKASGS